MTEPHFTEHQLRRFNGERGQPKYVAYRGVVYDVSGCPKWQTEMHEQLHWPGQDLTGAISDAPHNAEVFDRPCVKRAGMLINKEDVP